MMNNSARPINELTGIKKRSSVLVRGMSHKEIAIMIGAIPVSMSDEEYVEWAKGPRGYSSFELWQQEPGNEGMTLEDYFNWLGFVEAAQQQAIIDQISAAQAASELARDQAQAAESSSRKNATILFPTDFLNDGRFWSSSAQGDPALKTDLAAGATVSFPNDATYGKVLQNSTEAGAVAPWGVIKPVPGRIYRVEVLARVTANSTGAANDVAIEFIKLDSAFVSTGLAAEVSAVAGFPASDADFTAADGLVLFKRDYTTPDPPPAYVRPRFKFNSVATANATVQIISFVVRDVTEQAKAEAAVALISGGVLAQFAIEGLYVSRNVANPNTQLDITTGQTRSSDNSTDIVLGAPVTVDLTVVGLNGRDVATALALGQSWHLHVIYNPTTEAVGAIASLSPTAPTLPAGFTKWRYIFPIPRLGSGVWTGASPTDGTNIPPFVQNDNDVTLSRPNNEFSGQTGNTAAQLKSLYLPLGIKLRAHLYAQANYTGSLVLMKIRDPAHGVPTAFGGTDQASVIRLSGNELYLTTTDRYECWTNTSAQVYVMISNSGATWALKSTGYTFNRSAL